MGDVVFTNTPSEFDVATLNIKPGKGSIIALHSVTGKVLVEKELDAPLHLGVAIQDEFVIFGTGYRGYSSTASLYVLRVD